MIRRLLLTCAVVLGATGIGWGQTSTLVKDAAELKAALADPACTGITLTADIEMDQPILITKEGFILNGVKPLPQLTAKGVSDNFITVKNANNVQIKDINIHCWGGSEKAKKSGIHIYGSTGVKLTLLSVSSFGGAGLVVNGSTVTANQFGTGGNGWGGVNVDKGEGVTSETSFTFDNNCHFMESSKIYSEKADQVTVTPPATQKWISSKGEDGKTYWKDASAPISTAEELVAAVAAAQDGDKILLPARTFVLSDQLIIKKRITLAGTFEKGDSTKIVADAQWKGSDEKQKNLIRIDANGAGLENLTVQKSLRSGIHVYLATGVTLRNVISRNNVAAGLIVNGSTVTATLFTTEGNGWYGVNVDQGEGVQGTPVFTIGAGCYFAEETAILSDKKDASAYVVSNEWTRTTNKEDKSVWVNKSSIAYAITSIPSSVVYGTANLPLIANVEGATITVPASNGIVSIKKASGDGKDSLQILKPGVVTLTLTTKESVTVEQQLSVTKRTISVSGITAEKKTYNGKTEVKLVTENMAVKGLVGTDKAANVLNAATGVLTSANAGAVVPVAVTATFKSGKAEYYDLIPITGVTANVEKAALTVTAAKPSTIDYGTALPTFTATTTGFVNSEAEAALGGKLQFDCPVGPTSLAGTYKVTPFGYTSSNYAITYTGADLTVNAIAPTAELTGVTINSVGANASVTVKGRILSNGGTETTKLKAELKAELKAKKDSEIAKTISDIAVKEDGSFTTDIKELSGAAYIMSLTVKGGDKTSAEVTSSEINLAAKMQNINLTAINRITYGGKTSLKAEGYAPGAKVTFTTSDSGVLAFNEDTTAVTAKKAGSATITVTATLDEYVTAVAKQTITVDKKSVTVTPTVAAKTYDGTKTATVTYTVNDAVSGDELTVSQVSADFANANAGKKSIILSQPLTLSGTAAANYQLVQPAGLTGTIAKAGVLTLSAQNVSRKYNDPIGALTYDLQIEGLVANETLATPNLYQGFILVTEANGSYTINAKTAIFTNYEGTRVTNGTVNILNGTPKVVSVNTTNASGVEGLLVDEAGWSGLTVKVADDSNKQYAYVTYDNGKEARGVTLEKKKATAPTFEEVKEKSLLLSKAVGDSDIKLVYGETKSYTVGSGYTVSSSDPGILRVTQNETSVILEAAGAGYAALVFTSNDGGVTSKKVQVDPKLVTLTASNTTKEYDGTATANVSLTASDEGAILNLEGITFNYATKDVLDGIKINPSKTIILTSNNYKLESIVITGKITPKALKVTTAVSKYYDGSTQVVLNTYAAEGLAPGEEVPLTAALTRATVGTENNAITAWSVADKNYTVDKNNSTATGTIIKSTLDVILPSNASSIADVKSKTTYLIRETGVTIKGAEAGKISATLNVVAQGSNSFLVNGGSDTENYSLAFSSNQIGLKSDPIDPPVDPETPEAATVSLNVTTKSLALNEEFTLIATVTPTGTTVTWESSDPTIATVDASGKVKALKIGTCKITATAAGETATCDITVTTTTGIQEILSNTRVYAQDGTICIDPAKPINVMITTLGGATIYHDQLTAFGQIPAGTGVYVVRLSDGKNVATVKLLVK